MAPLLLLAAACGREAVPTENGQANAAVAIPAFPTKNEVAVPTFDQKSPEAAVAVLKDYFRLVEERKFVEAHRRWTGDELSDGAFAAHCR